MLIPILDCDNTIYRSNTLFEVIGNRIVEFMRIKFSYREEVIHDIRKQYWKDYGTTLAGLLRHNSVDPTEYLEFIHDVSISEHIKPNPNLKPLLLSLETRIIIMSNAPEKHVLEVLELLDISDIPEQIFAIEDFSYEGKPFLSSYNHVFEKTGLKAEETIMFDDAPQNLVGAKEAGMKTCLVGSPDGKQFDYTIPDISHIKTIIRE